MRSSNKNRSRSKNGRKSLGNIINRVFESAGPEGKVRGTPQQIIEKYTTLSRDAQTAGDRVAGENFQQHAEHYIRLLADAQREMAPRADNPGAVQHSGGDHSGGDHSAGDAETGQGGQQPEYAAESLATIGDDDVGPGDAGLVDTPEGRGAAVVSRDAATPADTAATQAAEAPAVASDAATGDAAPAEAEAPAAKPRSRAPRRRAPRAKKAASEDAASESAPQTGEVTAN